MNIQSMGHRLAILKSIYDVKIKQNFPIEPDSYVPPCESNPVLEFCAQLLTALQRTPNRKKRFQARISLTDSSDR